MAVSSEERLRVLVKEVRARAVYGTIMGRACSWCSAATERRTDELVHDSDCLALAIDNALAASETSDLERLVAWLEAKREKADGYMYVSRNSVLNYIADTFGVGEGG